MQVLPQQDGEDDVRLARQRIGRRHRAPLVEFLALVIVRVRLWREQRSKSAEAGKPCEKKSASVRFVPMTKNDVRASYFAKMGKAADGREQYKKHLPAPRSAHLDFNCDA